MLEPYPIPKSLWDSLEAVLYTKGVALAREVAAELNVSPKDIIANLKLQETSKFIVTGDDDDTLYQCQALSQHGSVHMRCRHPALGPAPRFCNKHVHSTADIPCLPLVKRLVCPEATYVYSPITGDVYTLNGILCGKFKSDRLKLFDVLE